MLANEVYSFFMDREEYYGAGYYDRFLADFKGVKIGICYNFQLLDEICTDTHDIPMDYIISEENIYAV